MSDLSNPFCHRHGEANLLYGRKQMADDLLNHLIGKNVSFGLCGGPKMGKTTLLRYIEQELFRRTIQEIRGGVLILPIYLNCLDLCSIPSITAAYELILEQLIRRFQRKNDSLLSVPQVTGDISIFKNYLQFVVNSQATYKVKFIFLFDNVNLIVDAKWGSDFFANWNSLLTKTPNLGSSLTTVFAGTSELYKVSKDIGSPLSNILTWKELELFSIQETKKVMNEPSNYDWPIKLIEEVYNATGGHPFLIQYIMGIMYELFTENPHLAIQQAKSELVNKQKTVFQYWWDSFDQTSKAIYSSLANHDSVKREVVFAEFGYPAQRAIDVLAHTGMIKVDLKSNTVRITGSLFKDWYTQFVSTPIQVSAKHEVVSTYTKAGEREMNILELLTTTTIPVAVKFLFDQLNKYIDNLSKKQLDKIEQTKNKVNQMQENRDINSIRILLNELFDSLPENINLDSKSAFKSWVHQQISSDYADLPAVGELLYGILIQKRENETNETKKDELLRMAGVLNDASRELRSHIRTGDDANSERKEFHKRIIKAVDLL